MGPQKSQSIIHCGRGDQMWVNFIIFIAPKNNVSESDKNKETQEYWNLE